MKSEKLFEMLRFVNEYPNLTATDLALLCNISERGIYRYLKTLSKAGIDVHFDGTGYRLAENVSDLLQEVDTESLLAARSLLRIGMESSEDTRLTKHGRKFLELIDQNLPREELAALDMIRLVPPGASPHHRGGTITIGHSSKPGIINPILTFDTISATLMNLIFSSLVSFDAKRRMVPNLARAWEVSRDGLVWTFFLREDVRFHDGHPLTSSDVEFTYKAIMDPKNQSPYSERYDLIERFETDGEYVFRAYLKYPFAPFVRRLNRAIVPKHLLEGVDLRNTDFNRQPVGSGPFKMLEWQEDDTIVLEANKGYFEAGRPIIDRVVFKVCSDTKAAISKINHGEIDVILNLAAPDILLLRNAGKFRIHPIDDSSYYALFFNLRDPLFEDIRVRMAIDYAVDREYMVDKLLRGYGRICTGPFGTCSWANNPEVLTTPHSEDKALKLMGQVGWKPAGSSGLLERNGKQFELTITIPQVHGILERIAVAIKAQLMKIGMKVKLNQIDISEIHNMPYQILLTKIATGADPDYLYGLWHSRGRNFNLASYSNKTVDRLLEQGRTAVDAERRTAAYHEIHEIIHDDYPAVFLASGSEFVGSTFSFGSAEFSSIQHFLTTMKDWQIVAEEQGSETYEQWERLEAASQKHL